VPSTKLASSALRDACCTITTSAHPSSKRACGAIWTEVVSHGTLQAHTMTKLPLT